MLAGARADAARPTVSVLVMSPGAHPFERFGHAAIRVDPSGDDGDEALVYNYGTFDSGDPAIVQKFLRHELPFWLSVTNWRATQHLYARRQITRLELNLGEPEARELARRLAENALPAHRDYVYEFFRDNCSTRVRDMVAQVAGELEAARAQPPQASLRAHVRAVLAPVPLLRRAIDLALNGAVDAPSSRWEDAFLPRELAGLLREVRRPSGEPLVAREEVWTGGEFRDLTQPISPWVDLGWLLLLVPLGVAAVDGGRREWTRVLAGVGLGTWGLVTGLLGTALVVMASTPYDVARGNGNLWALWPGTMVLVPYGVRLALGRVDGQGMIRLRVVLCVLLVPILIDLGAHGLGWASQRHVAVMLTVAAGHALAWLALRNAIGAPMTRDRSALTAPGGSDTIGPLDAQ